MFWAKTSPSPSILMRFFQDVEPRYRLLLPSLKSQSRPHQVEVRTFSLLFFLSFFLFSSFFCLFSCSCFVPWATALTLMFSPSAAACVKCGKPLKPGSSFCTKVSFVLPRLAPSSSHLDVSVAPSSQVRLRGRRASPLMRRPALRPALERFPRRLAPAQERPRSKRRSKMRRRHHA